MQGEALVRIEAPPVTEGPVPKWGRRVKNVAVTAHSPLVPSDRSADDVAGSAVHRADPRMNTRSRPTHPRAAGALEHKVRVTAELAEDELRVLVADAGPGIDAGPGSRGLGLGLTLMSAICDGFLVVDRAGRGTELRLRFKLGRSRRQGIVLAAG